MKRHIKPFAVFENEQLPIRMKDGSIRTIPKDMTIPEMDFLPVPGFREQIKFVSYLGSKLSAFIHFAVTMDNSPKLDTLAQSLRILAANSIGHEYNFDSFMQDHKMLERNGLDLLDIMGLVKYFYDKADEYDLSRIQVVNNRIALIPRGLN